MLSDRDTHVRSEMPPELAASETDLFSTGTGTNTELDAALAGGKSGGRWMKSKRARTLITGSAALTLVVAIVFTMLPTALGAEEGGAAAAYKETPVSRGSLTVGISESGTVAVNTRNATSQFTAEVLEVYVRAGQQVQAGDPLVQLDLGDVEGQLASLELAVTEARLAYSEAALSQKSTLVSAEHERAANQALDTTAQQEYDNTVTRLQNAKNSARNSYQTALNKIAALETNIAEYEGYIAQGYTYLSQATAASGSGEQQAAQEPAEEKAAGQPLEPDGSSEEDSADPQAAAAGAFVFETPAEQPQEADDASTAAAPAGAELTLAPHMVAGSALPGAALMQKTAQALLASGSVGGTNNEQTLAERLADAREQLADLQASLPSLLLAIDEADLAYTTGELEAAKKYAEAMNQHNSSGTIYSNTATQASLGVERAKQSLEEAEDALAEAQEAAASGYILAPCTGLVQNINYSAGDTVSTGMPIAVVTDASTAYITVSITQDDIGDVELGKAVNISLAAFDAVYTGEVDAISTTAAREGASTVSYTVSILIQGDTSGLYTGMTGDVTFITKQVNDVVYVSNNAVFSQNSQSYVKILGADGSIQEVEVETGFSDGRNVEIVSGLNEGDVAIIESGVSAV